MPNGLGLLTALRAGVRQLSRSPGFSAVVILIIALGIGVNTAIFSVIRAVMLRPLPMTEPDRLVRLRETFAEGAGETQLNLAPITWKRWREHNDVFTDIAAATGASFTLTGEQGAEFVPAALVSVNFFRVLGVRPAIGRDFLDEEQEPGKGGVVLVSHGFWQRFLGGDDRALGRVLVLDGAKRTVVGVMPKEFRHPYRADIWTPLVLHIPEGPPTGHFLYAPARLKPGVTIARATESMRELCARLAQETPGITSAREARVVPLQDSFVQESRPRMFAILAAAGFVLLIAGANIASLLLARHVSRASETGLRIAFGATRPALLVEFLAQSLVLAVIGSALGVWLATSLTPALYSLSPMASDATGNAMREFDTTVRLDSQVLVVIGGLTLLVGLGFGLLPALRGTREDIRRVMRGAGRGVTLDRSTSRTLGALVVAEIAVAMVLLVGTGLMVKSFSNLVTEDWGFETKDRVAFDVTFSFRLRPDHGQRTAYLEEALDRLRALPGVRSASATTLDLIALSRNLASITPQGSTPPEPRGYFITSHRMVMPGYFRDFGIPIVRGRALDDTDTADAPKVAVVSEDFAKRFWPGEDPIGKTIKRGRPTDPRPPYTVVGVSRDIHAVTDPEDGDIPGMWFLSYAQNPGFLADDVTIVVHSALPVETLQKQIRAELNQVDSSIAPHEFNTVSRLIEDSRAQDRFGVLLVGLFGALGLVLSAVGLYGLLSFQVAHRTREFGVRTAMGARAGDTIRLILKEGGALLLLGLALGFAIAMALARIIESQLYEVRTGDPAFYIAASLVLTIAAALACGLPARRAARVEPMVALRDN